MHARKWIQLGVGAVVGVAITTACGKPLPPPAAADNAIEINGKFSKLDSMDDKYLHYAIGENIASSPENIMRILTDAEGYPDWNSTVVGIEGKIAKDEEIALHVKISKRTFKLTVTEFDQPTKMVWQDGNNVFMGTRTFTLSERDDGSTDYTMKEAFTGSMVPMIAKKLPDFGPDFDAFAADLKKEAEGKYPLPEPEPEPEPEPDPPVDEDEEGDDAEDAEAPTGE